MAPVRMRAVVWIYGFLQFCSAQDITCTVTHDADQTTYTVSKVSHVSDGKASYCEYSWTNASNFVLANHMEGITALVRRNTINVLITSKCFDKIIFTRNCVSEGEEYTATCIIICSGSALFQEDNDTSHNWITAMIIVIILLLLMGIIVFYKWKDKILKKTCSCCQNGGIYTV